MNSATVGLVQVIRDGGNSKYSTNLIGVLLANMIFIIKREYTYFLRSTILAIVDFLCNLMCYFNHLYIELYTSKIYKNLIL